MAIEFKEGAHVLLTYLICFYQVLCRNEVQQSQRMVR